MAQEAARLVTARTHRGSRIIETAPSTAGIYMAVLDDPEALDRLEVDDADYVLLRSHSTLYVGRASDLRRRIGNHVLGSTTAASPVRYAVAALIAAQRTTLNPPWAADFARGRGKDVTLSQIGEAMVTAWIESHVSWAYIEVSERPVVDAENEAIAVLKPLWNVRGREEADDWRLYIDDEWARLTSIVVGVERQFTESSS